ncbi:MAG: shikimate kinase [Coriobacteriales bacterium]|nr:shikimate kinase [Coriobacteriales bacterium]
MQTKDGYITHEGCDHIFFVGFLGAGKSTLARNLGRLYRRTYVDTDRMAERIMRKTVRECFEQDGEETFRRIETQVLERLQAEKSLLVSCGGGIVECEHNCELMHKMGVVVFLDGDLSDSLRQIQHPEKRPDLCLDHVEELYRRRRPLFIQSADYVINIRDKSFGQVAEDAGRLLWEEGLL